jgi:hypothetical protein
LIRSGRSPLAQLPPRDGRRVDAENRGGGLLTEPHPDPYLSEALARGLARRPGAVPEEQGDPGDEADFRSALPPLPVEDRERVDTDFVGNFLLEKTPQDALPAEVFAPGLRLLRKGRIFGFSGS